MEASSWLWLSPLTGAAIGLITNYLAIRMLFRPLRAIRILGIRLPMTPGVIPARRAELAANIGRTVGERLLTAEALTAQLRTPLVRDGLRRAASGHLHALLDTSPRQGLDNLPPEARAALSAARDDLGQRLGRVVLSRLQSDDTVRRLAAALRGDEEQSAAELLGEDMAETLSRSAAAFVTRHFPSDTLNATLLAEGIAAVRSARESERTLGDVLPDTLFDAMEHALERELPGVAAGLGDRLGDAAGRDRFRVFVRELLYRLLRRMGLLAGLFSITLNPRTLDAKIDEFLAERRNDLEAFSRSASARTLLEPVARSVVGLLRERPVAALIPDDGTAAELLEPALSSLLEPDRLSAGLAPVLEDTIRSALDRFPTDLEKGDGALLEGLLSRFLHSDGLTRSVREAASAFLVETLERTLDTPPLAWLPRSVVEGLDASLLNASTRLLEQKVPGILESLDIRRIVEDKVNSLNLLEVEALIEDILNRELKAITLFGALLGGVVGALNALIMFFA